MPTEVSFKWLNNGEETTLAEMPLRGQREILDLQKNRAKYQAAMTKYRFILLCESAIAAKKMLDRFGVEKACEAWNATIEANFNGNRGLMFKEESFEEDLQAWLDDFVLRRLGASTLEEVRVKLDEATTALNEEMSGINSERIIETNHELYLLTAYWRLRSSGIKAVDTPEGPKEVPWALDAKETALEIISEVITDEDMIQFYGNRKDKEIDVEDLVPQEASDVQGKSKKPAEPTTKSVADSDASSEPITETIEKQN